MKKRVLAILLTMALVLPLAACGDDDDLSRVLCTEQGFETRAVYFYPHEFVEDQGLTIYMGAKGNIPYVSIWLDEEPMDDPLEYITEELTPSMREKYGDNLHGTMLSEDRIGGKKLPVATYTFSENGQMVDLVRIYVTEDDYTVVYTAKHLNGEGDVAMEALGNAIRYFEKNPGLKILSDSPGNRQDTTDHTDKAADDNLSVISCPELGFTTKADASYPWEYKEGIGVKIYTGIEGYVPYLEVWQAEKLFPDAYEFIREYWTPKMQEQYGDDLESSTEYRSYEIGGKQLPAGLYVFRLEGRLLEELIIRDSTGNRTAEFVAIYHPSRDCLDGEESEEADTMAALDKAIRNFKSDVSSQIADGSDQVVSGDGGAYPSETGETEPDKMEYEHYDDSLISMDIPKGWEVYVNQYRADAVHYTFQVVDPDNRDYQILFSMKLELGNLASERDRQIYANNGYGYYANTPFAKLPPVDPQNTEGFFRVWNETWDVLGGFQKDDLNFVFPYIGDFTPIEKIGTQAFTGGDILWASFKNEQGDSVQGIFAASPMLYYLGTVNAVVIYNVMCLTAPPEKFEEMVPVLTHCFGSISFSERFDQNYYSQEQVIFTAGTEIAKITAETSDIIIEGWEKRQNVYDEISKDWSKAFRGG